MTNGITIMKPDGFGALSVNDATDATASSEEPIASKAVFQAMQTAHAHLKGFNSSWWVSFFGIWSLSPKRDVMAVPLDFNMSIFPPVPAGMILRRTETLTDKVVLMRNTDVMCAAPHDPKVVIINVADLYMLNEKEEVR